jgi:hypothetical protein
MDQVSDEPDTGTPGWYHCGRCGALFRTAEPGLCPECHASPTVEEAEIAFAKAESARQSAPVPAARPESEPPPPGARRGPRPPASSRSKGRGLLLFVAGWLILMVLVVGWVKLTRTEGDETDAAGDRAGIGAAEHQRQLAEAYETCEELLGKFMTDGSPESRVRHVHNPDTTLPKMIRAADPAPVLPEDEEPKAEFFNLFEPPAGGSAIESRWKTPEDDRLEVVFLRGEDEAWKIDWENLVRWSATSWPLFLAGDDEATAEFRVFARRPASRSGGTAGADRVRLLEPRPWNPALSGPQSPEITIDPDSRTGRVLEAAFRLRERGEGVFGTRLHENDPKDMVRLRVRLRREPGDLAGRPQFHIEEILACHWMSIDGLGVDPGSVE